ncbi:unnamed protein product, partial [Amoebophrya sp. A120]
ENVRRGVLARRPGDASPRRPGAANSATVLAAVCRAGWSIKMVALWSTIPRSPKIGTIPSPKSPRRGCRRNR